MTGQSLDAESQARVRQVVAECGGNITEAARRLGMDRGTVRKYAGPARGHADQAAAPRPVAAAETIETPVLDVEEKGGVRKVIFSDEHQVRTMEDALAKAEVDPAVWRVRKWSCNSHEVVLKIRRFDESGKIIHEEPVRKALWQVKLELERIIPDHYLKAAESIFERMGTHVPDFGPRRPRKPPRRPYLLELDLMDHHFGALCWAKETGQDYDLKIAERIFADAVSDLLARAAPYEVERFLIPVGNDFFHVDNLVSTTTAGTFQDSDGRYHKIIEVGEEAIIRAVDRCLAVAPVDVLHVPGNHDRVSSWHLCRVLRAHYRNTPDVTVDVGPAHHKFYRYGATLLGFSHGDETKPRDMPTLMATLAPQDWAATTHRELHLGHLHQSKRFDFPSIDTHQGVVVRYLHSLKATDSWHAKKGYLSPNRAAEAYLWDREHAYAGHFVSMLRPER